MARVPWKFDSYQWPTNPEEDSDWIKEVVLAEDNPINARTSIIQRGGIRSGRRRISGWLYGPKAMEQKNLMQSWLENGTQSRLYDHNGQSKLCMLVRFEPKLINDVAAFRQGRVTFRYDAEFVALEP